MQTNQGSESRMNADKTPLIEFSSVDLGYRRKTVAKDISFTIHKGEFVGIVGPNGSGKTTIVRAMLGILKAQRGTIKVRGHSGERLRVGYVPQRDSIDPIMPFTVNDVVLMGRYGKLGLVRLPSRIDRQHVQAALKNVDLLERAGYSYKDLSGGQKQRTLIARALAADPDILILDEPTNGMDLTSRTAIMELIRHLHEERDLTVIMVSHLLSDVANYVESIMLVEQDFFQVGLVSDILNEANLSRIYNIPVSVGEWKGSTIIIARGKSV
jgi:ABC-type Mn2+/Zn2+ transport system ATPase subunit